MDLIPVSRGIEYLEVHPVALAQHKEFGWAECERRAAESESEPPEGGKLSISEIREALTAKGVDFDPKAGKAELRALLDAQG